MSSYHHNFWLHPKCPFFQKIWFPKLKLENNIVCSKMHGWLKLLIWVRRASRRTCWTQCQRQKGKRRTETETKLIATSNGHYFKSWPSLNFRTNKPGLMNRIRFQFTMEKDGDRESLCFVKTGLFVSSDWSSYSYSVLLYRSAPLFEILSISANIWSQWSRWSQWSHWS